MALDNKSELGKVGGEQWTIFDQSLRVDLTGTSL